MLIAAPWKKKRILFAKTVDGTDGTSTDGITDTGTTDGTSTDGTSTDTGTKKNDPPAVPQEKVNKLLAEERRKAQEKIKKQTEELEKFKQSASLTEAEKNQLAEQIAELNNTLMSKEELAKKKLKETEEKSKTELASALKTADFWKNKFESSLVERTILDVAGPEAVNPQQFIPVLAPQARVVYEADESGNPNAVATVKVKVKTTDTEGKDKVLDVTASEAVSELKKQPLWQNLFKSSFTGGTGFNPGVKGAGTQADVSKMTPEQYRKEGRKQLGLK